MIWAGDILGAKIYGCVTRQNGASLWFCEAYVRGSLIITVFYLIWQLTCSHARSQGTSVPEDTSTSKDSFLPEASSPRPALSFDKVKKHPIFSCVPNYKKRWSPIEAARTTVEAKKLFQKLGFVEYSTDCSRCRPQSDVEEGICMNWKGMLGSQDPRSYRVRRKYL